MNSEILDVEQESTEKLALDVLKVLDGLTVNTALCVLTIVAPGMLKRSMKVDVSKLDVK